MRFGRLFGLALLLGLLGAILALAAPDRPASAETGISPTAKCKLSEAQNQINVVLLLDASGSLEATDPDRNRRDGLQAAVENLAELAGNDAANIDIAVDTFNTVYHNKHGWQSASDARRELIGRYSEITSLGSGRGRTDYREAMRGLDQRFDAASTTGTCNLLLWFTDGEHATDGSNGVTPEEWQQVETLCSSTAMGDLSEINLYTVGVLLQSSAGTVDAGPLRYLFGEDDGRDCPFALNGEIKDEFDAEQITSALDELINEVVYEVQAELPTDDDLPNEEQGLPEDFGECEGVGTADAPCVYEFTLDPGTEGFRLFLDMTFLNQEIRNPEAIRFRLVSPSGRNEEIVVAPQGDANLSDYQPVRSFGFWSRRPYDSRWEIIGHIAAQERVGDSWEWEGEWDLQFWGDTPQAADEARKVASALREITDVAPTAEQMSVNEDGTLTGFVVNYPGGYSDVELRLQPRDNSGEPVYPARENLTCRSLTVCDPVPVGDSEAGRRFVIPSLFDELLWWDSADGGGDTMALDQAHTESDPIKIVAVLGQSFTYGNVEEMQWSRDIGELPLAGLTRHLMRRENYEDLKDWLEMGGSDAVPLLSLEPAPYEVSGDQVSFGLNAGSSEFGGVVTLQGATAEIGSETKQLPVDFDYACSVPPEGTDCPEIAFDLGLSSDSDVIAVLHFEISPPGDLEEKIRADGVAPSRQQMDDLWREVQERTQPRTESVRSAEFRVDLATASDTFAKFLPILLTLIVLAGLLRVLVAWRLRPWNALGNAEYQMQPLSMDALDRSIEAAEKNVCMDLTRRAVTARVGDVTLASSWIPLLFGKPPSIEAVHSGGAGCAGPRAIRPEKDRAVGIVGSSLQQGWVVVAHSDSRFELIVWDLPSALDDQTQHVRDVEDAARDAVERLRADTRTGSGAESAETTQSRSGDSPPRDSFGGSDDPFSGTSDPSGGSGDPFRSSDNPFNSGF
ncbi:MAG: hypothetical protein OXB92_12895 [Acidimicrobiaceae bacterium]|nr:hypothetical protein [Acidimicrobiia bacterium]MCY4494746.1 hypothetical protein [Acidimicrobiaceae bacterium]